MVPDVPPRLATASSIFPRRSRRRGHRETGVAYLFLAPGYLLFALVILYPIARAFEISLFNWSIVPGSWLLIQAMFAARK